MKTTTDQLRATVGRIEAKKRDFERIQQEYTSLGTVEFDERIFSAKQTELDRLEEKRTRYNEIKGEISRLEQIEKDIATTNDRIKTTEACIDEMVKNKENRDMIRPFSRLPVKSLIKFVNSTTPES